MHFFNHFQGVSIEKLKKKADSGYEEESIELSYQYLRNKKLLSITSVNNAINYLKPIVIENKSKHLEFATKFYIEALFQAYLNETNTQKVTERLEEADRQLIKLIKNTVFKLNEAEQKKFYILIDEVCKKLENYNRLYEFLENCIVYRKTFFAYYQLANLYLQFEDKLKASIAYCVASLPFANENIFKPNGKYGKNKLEYLKNMLQLDAKDSVKACLLMTAFVIILPTLEWDFREILDLEVIRNNFNLNITFGRFSVYNIAINKKEDFFKILLQKNCRATISMVTFCYKHNLIEQAAYYEFLNYVIDDFLKNTSLQIPDSQIDKLRLGFFSTKYKQASMQELTIEQRFTLLIEVADAVLLMININQIDQNKLELIAEITMELISTDHLACIAKAFEIHAMYGTGIELIGNGFKEAGLANILQNKQKALSRAKEKILINFFGKYYENLQLYLLDDNLKRSPYIYDKLKELFAWLDTPAKLINQEISKLINNKDLQRMGEIIKLIGEDCNNLEAIIQNFSNLDKYFQPQNLHNIGAEIEAIKLTYQSVKKLLFYLKEFENELNAYITDEWEKELAIQNCQNLHNNNEDFDNLSNTKSNKRKVSGLDIDINSKTLRN